MSTVHRDTATLPTLVAKHWKETGKAWGEVEHAIRGTAFALGDAGVYSTKTRLLRGSKNQQVNTAVDTICQDAITQLESYNTDLRGDMIQFRGLNGHKFNDQLAGNPELLATLNVMLERELSPCQDVESYGDSLLYAAALDTFLLWAMQHNMLADVVQTFKNIVAQCAPTLHERIGTRVIDDKVTFHRWIPMVAIYAVIETARCGVIDWDMPWDWQAPLFVGHVLQFLEQNVALLCSMLPEVEAMVEDERFEERMGTE